MFNAADSCNPLFSEPPPSVRSMDSSRGNTPADGATDKQTTQVRISPQAVVFITTATAIYSLGHGLHTLTAVPRLTQPSTLRGTVK